MTEQKPEKPSFSDTPQNLEECFARLKKLLPKDELERFRGFKDENMAYTHFGMGMWIRNNWGLWHGSSLVDYFNQIGIFHPDDMSSIIVT